MSVPVPWFQWKKFRVHGIVREQASGRPIPELLVRAYDDDVVKDDHLGDDTTDAEGRFEISFDDSAFKDLMESRPDIYLQIFVAGQSAPIHDTASSIRQDASRDEYFEIEIPSASLAPS